LGSGGERSGAHPDDLAGGLFYFTIGKHEERGEGHDMEGGDEDEVPPESRVVHVRG